jgi:hypothetical protein
MSLCVLSLSNKISKPLVLAGATSAPPPLAVIEVL